MTMRTKNKILALILCFLIGFTVAACTTRVEPAPSESSVPESSAPEVVVGDGKTFVNTLELPAGPYAKFALPKFTTQVQEKYEQNSDTVGWLQVPNTTIDDVVVWYPNDNNFYYRRNFEKRQSFNGIFYADYRCTFEGGANGLAPNTVIYGHSMSDDPLDKNELFSPLKFFKNEEFARETPYVYFSLADEDLAWEVFAVFYAAVSADLPYNLPILTDFTGVVDGCRQRSIYNYETQVSPTDKILTLSTCFYYLPDGTYLGYPNNYRYVVMAKLVTDTSNLKNEASFTVNPSPKAP